MWLGMLKHRGSSAKYSGGGAIARRRKSPASMAHLARLETENGGVKKRRENKSSVGMAASIGKRRLRGNAAARVGGAKSDIYRPSHQHQLFKSALGARGMPSASRMAMKMSMKKSK